MVEQDSDRHERRRAGPDLRVEQEDGALLGTLERGGQDLGQRDLVQERFTRLGITLNEDAPDGHVADDAPQTFLERGARAEDRDAAEVALGNVEFGAGVDEVERSFDALLAIGEEGQGVFDDEGREAIGEKDEVFRVGLDVAEQSVDALNAQQWSAQRISLPQEGRALTLIWAVCLMRWTVSGKSSCSETSS